MLALANKRFPNEYLGIEFYLFVFYGGINDRGSTCKFRNARLFIYWSKVLTERFSIPYKNQTKEDTSL